MKRRNFLKTCMTLSAASTIAPGFSQPEPYIMTVSGPLSSGEMGRTLIHEHILVDFIGADKIKPDRWNRADVAKAVLPLLNELKAKGCSTFIDCTPAYLGRDPVLLQMLSRESRLNILTNTGYYGGSDHKFLPPEVFTENARFLADRWIHEWEHGISNTSVKPGFIKISVNGGKLSSVSLKLIEAAAHTHLNTGLTIASHTGPAVPALEQIEVLKNNGVNPEAFIWVHAQAEQDKAQYAIAARQGAWISLDGLNQDNVGQYVESLLFMQQHNLLDKTLVSHDAGWYDPARGAESAIRGYTTLFDTLIPALVKAGFTESDVDQLLVTNAQNAFSIRVRK